MNIPLRQYWRLLSAYLRPQRRRVLLLALLLFTGIGLQLLNPQLLRYVIDTALAQGQRKIDADAKSAGVTLAALLFFALALAQQLFGVFTTYAGETVAWTATNNLRHDLAAHALRLDQAYHNLNTPGQMIERIDGDVTLLSNFFSMFFVQLVGHVLLVIGVVVLFMAEDWRAGVVMGGFVIGALFILMRLRNIGVPHWKAARNASGELYGFIEERLAGTQDIRSSGAVSYVLRRFYELSRQIMKMQRRAALMQNVMVNASFLLFAVGNAVAFAIGALLFGQGALTLGAVYLIFYYVNLIQWPLDAITMLLQDLQQAGAAISRINDMTSVRPGIVEGNRDHLPAGPLGVAFEKVTFGYEEDGIILEDFSFKLGVRRKLGLLGRTGSGKTTIARLLLRLYDPQAGAVSIGSDGTMVDVRELRFGALRRAVGMVTQNVQLFNATVRDNLTLFDATISDRHILQVIEDLGLGGWLNALEKGLDTELASGGSSLSAGEAQLLALARIFLRDPGLIVLDEASSRLDPATEALIERALDKLLESRTAIIIAHRLATVTRADEILIIEDGQIVEHGERTALAHDDRARFHQLLKTGLEEVLA